MYVIIPLLSVSKNNYTNSVATQFIHRMSILNQTDPTTYSVSYALLTSPSSLAVANQLLLTMLQDALQLCIDNAIQKTSVIGIEINGVWSYHNADPLDSLRDEEKFIVSLSVSQHRSSHHYSALL
jgi:hypothetical protein